MSTLRMFSSIALGLLFAPAVWAQTIPNPSFEANSFTGCPGYAANNGGNITGWTISNVNGVGLNPSGCSPFADNGAIPNGAYVAFVQTSGSSGSSTNTLSTVITGLTLGRSYTVSFRANCRANYPTPSPTWSLNGDPYVPFTASPAVGGSNPYYTNSGTFTASATTASLIIRNASSNDTTVLIDAFSIVALPFVPGDQNGDGIVSQAELDAVYAAYVTNSPWLFMTNVAALGGSDVTFALSNSALGSYTVQYSTNLTNWSPLGTASPRYFFTDTNAPAAPQRYYRLVYP